MLPYLFFACTAYLQKYNEDNSIQTDLDNSVSKEEVTTRNISIKAPIEWEGFFYSFSKEKLPKSHLLLIRDNTTIKGHVVINHTLCWTKSPVCSSYHLQSLKKKKTLIEYKYACTLKEKKTYLKKQRANDFYIFIKWKKIWFFFLMICFHWLI